MLRGLPISGRNDACHYYRSRGVGTINRINYLRERDFSKIPLNDHSRTGKVWTLRLIAVYLSDHDAGCKINVIDCYPANCSIRLDSQPLLSPWTGFLCTCCFRRHSSQVVKVALDSFGFLHAGHNHVIGGTNLVQDNHHHHHHERTFTCASAWCVPFGLHRCFLGRGSQERTTRKGAMSGPTFRMVPSRCVSLKRQHNWVTVRSNRGEGTDDVITRVWNSRARSRHEVFGSCTTPHLHIVLYGKWQITSSRQR